MVAIVIHVIWFTIAGFFLLAALWAKLEQSSGRPKRSNPEDLFRQGLFVLGCVVVAYVIDDYVLQGVGLQYLPSWMPIGFVQLLLLPAILYIAAAILGPSKQILISTAPKTGDRRNQTKNDRRK